MVSLQPPTPPHHTALRCGTVADIGFRALFSLYNILNQSSFRPSVSSARIWTRSSSTIRHRPIVIAPTPCWEAPPSLPRNPSIDHLHANLRGHHRISRPVAPYQPRLTLPPPSLPRHRHPPQVQPDCRPKMFRPTSADPLILAHSHHQNPRQSRPDRPLHQLIHNISLHQ